ncbi:hypothetical protein EJA72_14380 [Pseudomonas sp. PB120]|nr:hypothetical protein [Pseudomonas sp. PB120]
MVVNDNAGYLIPRGALGFFASELAPTRGSILHVGEIVASAPIKMVSTRNPPRKIAILPI